MALFSLCLFVWIPHRLIDFSLQMPTDVPEHRLSAEETAHKVRDVKRDERLRFVTFSCESSVSGCCGWAVLHDVGVLHKKLLDVKFASVDSRIPLRMAMLAHLLKYESKTLIYTLFGHLLGTKHVKGSMFFLLLVCFFSQLFGNFYPT